MISTKRWSWLIISPCSTTATSSKPAHHWTSSPIRRRRSSSAFSRRFFTPTPMPTEFRPPADPSPILDRVREALHTLRYGVITLTVHDGTVVQIDRTERQRFDRRDTR